MAGIRTGNNSGNHPASPEPQVAPVACESELYIKTTKNDNGQGPTTGPYDSLYQSWDVAVHQYANTKPDEEMDQEPPQFGNQYSVNTRIRKKTADPLSKKHKLHIYWAYACTGLMWPDSFNPVNSDRGGKLEDVPLDEGKFKAGVFSRSTGWGLSRPSASLLMPTYIEGGRSYFHVCLLVRIVPTCQGGKALGPFESMPGEVSRIADNVRNFSNIAWKNTNWFYPNPVAPVASSWVLIAPSERPRLFRLKLAESRSALIQRRKMRMSIWGNHIGRLVNRIYPAVAAVGPVAGDVDRGEGDEYITVDSSMDFVVKPTAEYIKLEFNIDSQDGWPAGERQEFDVVEYAGDDDQLFVGGQHFVLDTDYLRKPQEPRRRSIDCPDDRPAQRRGLLQRLLSPRGRGR